MAGLSWTFITNHVVGWNSFKNIKLNELLEARSSHFHKREYETLITHIQIFIYINFLSVPYQLKDIHSVIKVFFYIASALCFMGRIWLSGYELFFPNLQKLVFKIEKRLKRIYMDITIIYVKQFHLFMSIWLIFNMLYRLLNNEHT